MKINAEIKKEEMKINAKTKADAKVLPFLHDFVYNSIDFFPFFLESQNSLTWIVLLSPFMDIFKLSSLGSSRSPQAQSQISSLPTSSAYSSFHPQFSVSMASKCIPIILQKKAGRE